MSVTIDSNIYEHTFYGILNKQGQFWTPIPFYDEKDARAYLEEFVSRNRGKYESMLSTHRVVPVRIQLTSLARDSNSDPKGEDPSGAECGASQSGAAKTAHRPNSVKDSTS